MSGEKVWLCTPSQVEAQVIRESWPNSSCPIYITGVGSVATTESLWQRLCKEGPPQVIMVLGLAGGYDNKMPLYGGVQVRRERWAALGRRGLRSLSPLPPPLTENFTLCVESTAPSLDLPQVEGLTLESVSACRKEAAFWKRQYPDAVIETQENAAYLRFGMLLNIPVYALRLISNRVGEKHWDRIAALTALGSFARDVGYPLYRRLVEGEPSPP